jgi:putative addiction module killer protein
MVEVVPLEVIQHDVFRDWLLDLRDGRARARIAMRVRRMEMGNPGEFKPLGDGVTEMKIDYGPGYRVYYASMRTTIVILLCGGDKSTQDQDIKRAKELVLTVQRSLDDGQ